MAEETPQMSDRLLTILGVGAGVMQLAAFSWVGVLLFDSVPYGLAVGGLSGVGAFLFVPWLLSYSAAQEANSLEPTSERRNTGPGVFGFGLELGAVLMLTLGFVIQPPPLVLGVASALVVAVGAYLVGSFVLDR